MCRRRIRNKGLFTANDLNVANTGQNSAQRTRQNPNGDRYGTECPEERDYYPYWQPTIWRDIAILTNEPQRCAAYQAESENVKSRWFCDMPQEVLDARGATGGWLPFQEAPCKAFNQTINGTVYYATWKESPPHNIPAPACRQNIYTRDNHLGNTLGGYPISYNWTIPSEAVHERCVFRIRYNITSMDVPNFESVTSIQVPPTLTAAHNSPTNNRPCLYDIWSKFNIPLAENNITGPAGSPEAANSRGYRINDDPTVDIFGSLLYGAEATNRLKLKVALSTNQLFRTFEDRSHRFAVRSRAGTNYSADAIIHNVNVRGKRGNIVQVYPNVEYDFVPNRLAATLGDYVHFQWTGSNSNPNDDGQGVDGSDRSNVVGLNTKTFVESDVVSVPATWNDLGTNYPKRLTSNGVNFLGWDNAALIALATLSSPGGQFGGDMDEFDDAGTYFDMPPRQVNRVGIYNYMCSRNNNFSNRSQKGVIVVSNQRATSELIGWNGGVVKAPDSSAKITVNQGTFTSIQQIGLTVTPSATVATRLDDQVSDVVTVSGSTPDSLGGAIQLRMAHRATPLGQTTIMYTASLENPQWESVSSNVGREDVSADITRPGHYAVASPLNGGIIAGIVIGAVALLGLATFLICYCRKKAVRAQYELANGASSSV